MRADFEHASPAPSGSSARSGRSPDGSETPARHAEHDTGIQDYLSDDLDQLRQRLNAATTALLLVDESQQYLTARAARGLEEEVRQGSRVPIGLGFAGHIASERRPLALDRIDSATVVNPLLWRRGITALAGAPLMFEGRLLGVVHVGRLTGSPPFSPAEVEELVDEADRIARRLTEWRGQVDRAAASALQEGLTPRLPRVQHLDLAARYVPSSLHGVGGDWYDVFTLPGGSVGFAIGDVMGHGLSSATVMGRVRSALRAYAIEDDDPSSVLTRLDRKVQHFEFNQMITALYGILDPRTGQISMSSAGHLPPVLVPASGPVRSASVAVDVPLGVMPSASRRTTYETLGVGDLLFLYTDGLIERRGGDVDVAQLQLMSVLAGAADVWAEIACADVMSALVDMDSDSDDDISVLALRRLVDSARKR